MIKRPKISKDEIIADLIYLFVAMAISFMAIFVFDIHWSFYPGQTVFPPSKYIFHDTTPYQIGIPLGGIVGFLLLKLTAFAFMEEEKAQTGQLDVANARHSGNGKNKGKTKRTLRS